ncbi:MAG: hypothetical protein MJ239_02465 [Bacilli bacterium]|nr:hypothetical protein [Bacilli bacterium]
MENVNENRNQPTEGSRNQNQKIALTALYDVLIYREMNHPIDVESIVSGLTELPYEESDYFIKAVVVNAIKHLDEAIADLSSHMTGWVFSRRDMVEQAILLLAYTHFYYVEPDVDKGVVIDIAIRFSKVYEYGNNYKFVNAVLDKTLQR